jgi:predicted Zn-dependent protease
MDGRQFKWCLFGLILSAGCAKNTYPNNMLPAPGQNGVAGLPSSGGLFSKSKPNGPVQGMPGDTSIATSHKKGPMSPEAEVAMADVHLSVALADPPPPNRDEQLDMARARYQRALKQQPKNKDALLGMARMYAKLGDKDRAAESYDKYLKIYPKDAEVLHELGMRRAQWKDWPGAMACCEAALKFDPDNRTYRKALGMMQARAGKWDEALASLCKVMPEAQARHNLAGMLDHLGESEAARQQLQLAIKADPGYVPANEFLNDLNGEANPILQAGFNQPK